ncbi:unnamed protein product, partial [Nesidiocoris tenuis]
MEEKSANTAEAKATDHSKKRRNALRFGTAPEGISSNVGQGVDAGGKVGFTFGGSAGIGGGAGLAPSLMATDEGTGHNLQGAGGGAKADAELGRLRAFKSARQHSRAFKNIHESSRYTQGRQRMIFEDNSTSFVRLEPFFHPPTAVRAEESPPMRTDALILLMCAPTINNRCGCKKTTSREISGAIVSTTQGGAHRLHGGARGAHLQSGHYNIIHINIVVIINNDINDIITINIMINQCQPLTPITLYIALPFLKYNFITGDDTLSNCSPKPTPTWFVSKANRCPLRG